MFKNVFNTSPVRQIVKIVEMLSSTLHASSVRVPADFPRRFAAFDYTGYMAQRGGREPNIYKVTLHAFEWAETEMVL